MGIERWTDAPAPPDRWRTIKGAALVVVALSAVAGVFLWLKWPASKPRASVQTSAAELAKGHAGDDLRGETVEVAGVVVAIRDAGATYVSLGDREGGPTLVRVQCARQGPAEVGYHAVVRGRVTKAGAGVVTLEDGEVLKATR